MQDNTEGIMRDIPADVLKKFGLNSPKQSFPTDDVARDLASSEEALRQEMAKVIPREHQGAILSEGGIVDIKGGKFRVHAITSNRVYLEPVKTA